MSPTQNSLAPQGQPKVAFLAASSRGIGYGVARALAERGGRLFLGGRDGNSLAEAARNLSLDYGVEVGFSFLDAADPLSIKAWLEAGFGRFGQVNQLLVNAGGPPPGGFDQFLDGVWTQAFEQNLMSAVRLVRGVLPSMRRQGGGAILTVTSSSVKESIDGLLLSNVMRSAVAGLVKSLARELGPQNIRVNNLMPGKIDTERIHSLDFNLARAKGISTEEQRQQSQANIPLGRYGTIEEIGKVGAFLLSGEAGYLSGQSIAVDGAAMKAL
ncbi:MAG: 3-oxoacyl-ACP reductase [Candidatus Lambdaproteobacteria bacterium RIFOXYD1_FULL_56_27]|uniref:3-oxoacyl-ACP reductase n=1 Tax=Candidatus Lambdaproteobacteria bacterium RIFOXYD2_FULL_56_26 TaxID=1817773 RepID=A0A1F6GV56_9PROT|nr:MAG: 3-oxoacyl-ACP reductase [Candidatus Lambdaproteobacteria bacterium RIFOXYD2_FULL_56_26]OGH02307.1 MAG: 3-oxoacyl-ACP reductase [Candidatus Lambdaproteobacteria bacterium RIFOXYC1_FULL_56_13]OGH10077.1 MAG: 3-oxoacyl-ACP reductase [Candidatus Lambdaproteobacteria bacterium RIFOXYD1_FULL_56_27]